MHDGQIALAVIVVGGGLAMIISSAIREHCLKLKRDLRRMYQSATPTERWRLRTLHATQGIDWDAIGEGDEVQGNWREDE